MKTAKTTTARVCLIPFALLALLKQTCPVSATSSPVAVVDAQHQHQEQLADVALAVKGSKKFNWEPNENRTVKDADADFEQTLNEKLLRAEAIATQHQHHLSRKRRYLLFLEGSSFQVVYDLYIGVVDYTNYLVLGITVALAYELPSKAPSEILSDIRTKLIDGNLDVSRIDTQSNVTYVNSTGSVKPNYINFMQPVATPPMNYYYQLQPMFRPPMHPNYFYGVPDAYYRLQPPARRPDRFYYKYNHTTPRNPFSTWTMPQQSGIPANYNYYTQYPTQYPWWQLASRLSNSLRPSGNYQDSYYNQLETPTQRRQDVLDGHKPTTSKSAKTSQAKQKPARHRIYPIFGKRSINDNDNNKSKQHHRQRRSSIAGPELSKLDRIHIRHHRSTRQSFFEKIEKYLDKHKLHGHHCVLRALCETGQKANETKPTTFIGELLRAVFTMPEALDDESVAYKDSRYDRAHAFLGDCAAEYHLCTKSILSQHEGFLPTEHIYKEAYEQAEQLGFFGKDCDQI